MELVLPTHDVNFAASGDATVVAAPGEVQCALVELLVDALQRGGTTGTVALDVRPEGTGALVAATGGGELRLPGAEVVA